jgi:hypothetical protein
VTPDTNSALPQSLSLGVSQTDEDEVVPGEILVKLKDNKDLDKVAKDKGLAIGRKGIQGRVRRPERKERIRESGRR